MLLESEGARAPMVPAPMALVLEMQLCSLLQKPNAVYSLCTLIPADHLQLYTERASLLRRLTSPLPVTHPPLLYRCLCFRDLSHSPEHF